MLEISSLCDTAILPPERSIDPSDTHQNDPQNKPQKTASLWLLVLMGIASRNPLK